MLIGYARVSTHEQNLDLQLDALKKAGCEEIRKDKIKSEHDDRPGLNEMMAMIRAGDTLVVWRLDRLGRTLKQLIDFINDLNARNIGFRSLTENIDTTTSGGKLVFHIFGALAEFEKEIIRERTRAGLEAARARGRTGGRPKLEATDPKKIELAKKLYAEKKLPVQEICDTLHIGRSTLYRYVSKTQDEKAHA